MGNVGQPNEAPEDIEIEEVQEKKDDLIYPATKKGENALRRSAGSADPPLTSKEGVLSSNAFIIINFDT